MSRTIIFTAMIALHLAGPLSGQDSSRTKIQHDIRFGGLDVPTDQMFAAPIDLAVGPEGRVYVLDSRDNNIKVFSNEGTFLTSFGREGAGPGELSRPWILSIINGRPHVVDTGNGRIQIFAETGTYQRSYKLPADFGAGMSFAADGRLFISTRGFRSPKLIRIYDTQGNQLQEFGDVEGTPYEYFDFTAIKRDIEKGRLPDMFKNDIHPVMGPDSMVWAVYRARPLIVRYSKEGAQVSSHEISIPEYMTIYDTFIEENKKIENSPSRFVSLRYVTDVVINPTGDLYVLLNLETPMTVLVFSHTDGAHIGTLTGPADRISRIDFDEKGRLYALGAESHFVYRFVLESH